MSLLAVNNLTVGYGDFVVVEGVNLTVEEGEVVCLLGANGAGKTTMMSSLAGTLRPRGGTVFFDGQDLLRMKLHERVAAGVILCPEGRKVFPSLSVEENLFLGSFHRAARRSRQQKLAEVYSLFPCLQSVAVNTLEACRAASSRCSLLAERSWPTPGFCFSTSRRSVLLHNSSSKYLS